MGNGTADIVGGAFSASPFVARQVVTTGACNDCHGLLRIHGRRVDAQYCTTCHTSQIDTGGVAGNGDFSYMIHGLHAAKQMGLNYSIAGLVGAEVTYPQDVRNCTTCHKGTSADFYKDMPGVAACTGCHESITFLPAPVAGKRIHTLGVQIDDNCQQCHTAQSVVTNHGIPAVTPTTANLVAGDFSYTIVSVTSTAVGSKPVVTFRVNSPANAASDLSTSKYWTQTTTGASRLAVLIGWKTGNYTNAGAGITPVTGTTNTNGQVISIDALANKVAVDAATGVFKVTSTVAIPTAAGTGPIFVGVEGHPAIPADAVLNPATRIPVANTVSYWTTAASPVAATAPVLASSIVDLAACNACHANLSLHGNNRQGNLDLCTTCHNTEATDKARRPAAGGIDGKSQVPIDFKTMIHEIHRADIVVYGFGGSVNDFREVKYPMPLANCQACHTATGYFGPRAAQNGTTTILGNTSAENLRTTKWFATCGSCHTAGDGVAHMKGFGGGTGMTQAQIDALAGPQPVPALRAQ
jgi:OmcA/MtrC family decaheme c-type cytochrome